MTPEKLNKIARDNDKVPSFCEHHVFPVMKEAAMVGLYGGAVEVPIGQAPDKELLEHFLFYTKGFDGIIFEDKSGMLVIELGWGGRNGI